MAVYKWLSLQWLAVRGLTPKDELERRIVSGQAWEEFCDVLKAAGANVLGKGTPKDILNQAEGYRYLSRLVRAGLENFLEAADPSLPVLTSVVDGRRAAPIKIGSDNPDNLYQAAVIDARYSYRVSGSRGSVHYLGFGTQSGSYGTEGGLRTVCNRTVDEIQLAEDGTVELVLSVQKPDGVPESNWMPIAVNPTHGMFILRQTFLDHQTERPAELRIERMDREAEPSLLTAEQLDQGLTMAGLLVAGASLKFCLWADGFQRKHLNQLPLFDVEASNAAGGDPNIRYYHSYWKLEEDECLVIDAVMPPNCQHWNFQLNNHWMESLDYRYYPVWTNKFMARYREDGSIRIIVAHRDPNGNDERRWQGVWMDTAGHRQGTMCFRWIQAGCSDEVLLREHQPRSQVLKWHELDV